MSRRGILIAGCAAVAACSSGSGVVRDPASPTPASGPAAGVTPPPRGATSGRSGDEKPRVPVRPQDAPLATLREVVTADSLVGRRVRVTGHCTAVARRAPPASWTLESGGDTVEVRGLAPDPCPDPAASPLSIFVQIELDPPGGTRRLLLRLPE